MSQTPDHDPHELLKGLNDSQREAVTTIEGPLLVLAGPGSGKTRVLTHRIAYMMAAGITPWHILAVTFTNKAAKEMRERLEALVGPQARNLGVGTFHSICSRVLRREVHHLANGLDTNFTIYDTDDQLGIVRQIVRDMNLSDKQYNPRAIHSYISRAKNDLLGPEEYARSVSKYMEEIAARVYTKYDAALRRANAVDFDDLILLTWQLWHDHPEVLRDYQQRYRYVSVDEFQDTNLSQYDLVRMLGAGTPEAPGHGNLCAVADDDQCLLEGTLVTMADGSQRPIESVMVGDQVLSSYGDGDFLPASVLKTARRTRAGLGVRITTRSGRALVSTAEHTHFAGAASADASQGDRARIMITLCGARRDSSVAHHLALVGGDAQSPRAMESLGFEARLTGRRYEVTSPDMPTLLNHSERIRRATNMDIIYTARLAKVEAERPGGQVLPFTRAAAVRPGMLMFDGHGGYDVAERVESVPLDAPVYDLDIARTHNFIANGIVTHNSIYSWRGANPAVVAQFERDFPETRVVLLEQNYRSTQIVLDAANAVVRNNAGRKEKKLWTERSGGQQITVHEAYNEEEEASYVVNEIQRLVGRGEAKRGGVAVMYRTNAQSRACPMSSSAARNSTIAKR
ncbi:MAG TPA: UvrD-helicase domain-containing protein, partial [Ktedonobacterales bacterium]